MKQITIILISCFYMMHGFSQSPEDSTALHPDSAKTTGSSFTVGLVYANNANYYGQAAEERIPYAAVAASWRLKSGFYLTGLAYRLLNDPSGAAVSASNFGAGYNFKMDKHWTADLSYNHTFYPAYSPFLQASNPDNASLFIEYDNVLDSKITADYAFGKTQDFFVTAGTGKQISLGSIGPKALITFTPALELVAGTQHFYKSYLIEKRLRDSLLGLVLDPIFGNGSSQNQTPNSVTTATTQFNLISYTLKCPLAYNRSHYMIEAQYQLSILSNQAQSGAGKTNSFFSFSFYYQFGS
ncbi:MAG: hypothetical protein Q8918_16200 [Bacteroidota bacterium]|nr:hypothetical protein [Bacteroidota bacterium]MDP4251645.1 hypothetical protein [Bacteroidota bacterium]